MLGAEILVAHVDTLVPVMPAEMQDVEALAAPGWCVPTPVAVPCSGMASTACRPRPSAPRRFSRIGRG